MSYHIDKYDNSIVIDGFENGIADDPFTGIADMRNLNVISVPGEASVNFATAKISQTGTTGTMTTSSAGSGTVTLAGGSVDTRVAITFSILSDATKGIALNTTYWLSYVSANVYNLYSDYNLTSLINITADNLTGTWATINMAQPKFKEHYKNAYADCYFLVDTLGQVWSNFYITPTNGLWTYTGNTINNTYSHGNGLISYIPSNSDTSSKGYLFVFRDNQIDYATITSTTSLVWTYGWNMATGGNGTSNNLKSNITNTIHECFNAPDNVIYYCDGSWIGRFYEKTGQAFDPTNTATYIQDNTRLLPFTDTAQCLSFLGQSLMIGGVNNVIYPWDTTSPTFSYPILLAEYNVKRMVTVNTNTFIFAGNRGRIYYTNGSQAQLYKKIPDHISGTVEPYFTWGGACSIKNQLYFSALATTNGGTALTTYGGVWAIDLDTTAIRLTNKLSYGTYAGYATTIIPNFGNVNGTGLYIGWNDGASGYGVDITTAGSYSGSQATVDSDYIPIGTFNKPRDFERVEYRLTKGLTDGESITLKYRLLFDKTDSVIAPMQYTTISTDSTVGSYSNSFPVNFKNAQWIQLQAVLNSTTSSTRSYCRLKEFRITGLK